MSNKKNPRKQDSKKKKEAKKLNKQLELEDKKLLAESKKYERQLKKDAKAEERARAKIRKIREKQGYIVNEEDIVRFKVDLKKGLTEEQVEQRHTEGLANSPDTQVGKSIAMIFVTNIFTFFNMLFFGIAIVLIAIGEYYNLLFLGTVLSNMIIGIVQEIRAKKQIDQLSLMFAPTAAVIRGGEKVDIPVDEVVLDDVLVFKSGKQIGCDCILKEGTIEVNESLITGESHAINKRVGDILYSGSYVVGGTGLAIADKVGSTSYVEKLATGAKKHKNAKSDILNSLNLILKIVSIIIIPLAALTFINSYNGDNLNKAIKSTTGAMISMIPAGLFLLTTVALTVSVIRLAKKKVLVQELYCIEMLAKIDILCLDKTGTITDGTMKVIDSVQLENRGDYTIREIIGSMMNAFPESNATSNALIEHYGKNSILKADGIIPFSSQRKYSAVSFGKLGYYVIGAPEIVLNETNYAKIQKRVERFAEQGCRVIVLAHTKSNINPDSRPKSTTALAVIAIQDHIRDDAEQVIAYFKNNEVDVKVISGDNPITVSEIARRAGVSGASRYISLDGLTDEEVVAAATEYNVFGRVSPYQKKLLVQTFKMNKKTVAMTGDGVNDILALKEADCSIAMASGSDATKHVSHIVLLESNFSAMPEVVAEGRRVTNNIQRTAVLFLTKTLFTILLTIFYLIVRRAYPFSPNQLMPFEWPVIGLAATLLTLQPNTEKIKGKFITNVLRNVLPGALTVLFAHIIIHFLTSIEGFTVLQTPEGYTTVTLYVTTIIMFYVLYFASRPFNLYRFLVFVVSAAGAILIVVFLNDFLKLGYVGLKLPEILLVLVFGFGIYLVLNFIYWAFQKLRIISKQEHQEN
ncbi:MAG TPA: HAD-IC family P-type ATPase [Acholeplasma sp.]|nr:HAD-IC family P-type ATPase [Acholeplasma sp.]